MFVFVLPLVIAIVALGSMYNGVAVMLLWNWFAVPLGASAIGLSHAIGLTLLVAMFKDVKAESKGDKQWAETMTAFLMRPVIAIVLGYVIKTFIMGQS